MASSYMLEIVTPDRSFFKGEVEMTVVRSAAGDIGVLKDHEPTVAPLAIGITKIKIGKEMRLAACTNGFVNIEEGSVTIITDAAEWSNEIDVDRARAAIERAKERLESEKQGIDVERAQISMTRAMNRVKVAEKKVDGPY